MVDIDNYVNFLTMEIDAASVNSYIDHGGSFDGFDGSTGGYTKKAWTLIVAEKMDRNENLTQDVIDAIEFTNGSMDKSPDGYTTLQLLAFYHIGDRNYSYETVKKIDPDFNESIVAAALDFDKMNLLLMAVNNKMFSTVQVILDAFTEKAEVLHHYDNGEKSAYLALLQQVIDGVAEAEPIFYSIVDEIPSDEKHYGKPVLDGEITGTIDNLFLRVLLSGKAEMFADLVLRKGLDKIIDNESDKAIYYTIQEVLRADGLNDGEISYAGRVFPSYPFVSIGLLFYGKKLAPFLGEEVTSIGEKRFLTSGSIDGLNTAALYTSGISIKQDGKWSVPPVNLIPRTGNPESIFKYAAAGNVKDFTEGGKVNYFGSTSNILSAFNEYHSSLYADSDKSTGANSLSGIEDKYSSLVNSFLPGVDFSFYIEWQNHFNRDIS